MEKAVYNVSNSTEFQDFNSTAGATYQFYQVSTERQTERQTDREERKIERKRGGPKTHTKSPSNLFSFPLNLFPQTHTHIQNTLQNNVFAGKNLKFGENGRKFSKRVENGVGKGEIARYEQFLLFPQCFQKSYPEDSKKPGFVSERVKHSEIV